MNTTSQSAREKALIRATNARRSLASGGYYMPEMSGQGSIIGRAGGEEYYRDLINEVSSHPAVMMRGHAERISKGRLFVNAAENLRQAGLTEDPHVKNNRERAAAWRSVLTSQPVGDIVGKLNVGNPAFYGEALSQITDRPVTLTPYEQQMGALQDAPMVEPPELLEAPSKKRPFEEI